MSNIRKARSSKSALRLADLQETRRKAGFFVIARCQLTPRRGQRSRRGAFGAWTSRRRAFGAHPRCSDTPSRFVPERPLRGPCTHLAYGRSTCRELASRVGTEDSPEP